MVDRNQSYTSPTPAASHETSEHSEQDVRNRLEDKTLDVAPDISLLTLNATGESKYLGPSSGSFFARYASNFAHAYSKHDPELRYQLSQLSEFRPSRNDLRLRETSAVDVGSLLTPQVCALLFHRFTTWVHFVYPLYTGSYASKVLQPLFETHGTLQALEVQETSLSRGSRLIIFYLIMALGAVHVDQTDPGDGSAYTEYQKATFSGLSPDAIYKRAHDSLDSISGLLKPSITMIQILLLVSLYGTCRPSGNGQWQLAGLAMRVRARLTTPNFTTTS